MHFSSFQTQTFSVLPHLFDIVCCLFLFKKRLIITLFACFCCWFISLRYCVFSYRIKVSVNFVVFETHVLSLVKSSALRLFSVLPLAAAAWLLSLSISFQFFVTHKNNTHAHLSRISRTWALCFFFFLLIGGCVCVCVIMCIDFRSLLIANMTFLFVLLVLLKILLHF